jgi:kynureninase
MVKMMRLCRDLQLEISWIASWVILQVKVRGNLGRLVGVRHSQVAVVVALSFLGILDLLGGMNLHGMATHLT